MERKLPFKLDKAGIWYIDFLDITIDEIFFDKINSSYRDYTHFFKIEEINDYIIKECRKNSSFFDRYRELKLLKQLIKKQEKLLNIDFPVAYYKRNNRLEGIVIPYYKNAVSLKELLHLHTFEDLHVFYNHANNEIDNLISLLLDILKLISIMYDNGIYYLDIHSGNFLVYNNCVKIIDFEPGRIYFKKSNLNTRLILNNYALLVDKISRMYGFKEIFFRSGIDFYNTEKSIESLRKKLER